MKTEYIVYMSRRKKSTVKILNNSLFKLLQNIHLLKLDKVQLHKLLASIYLHTYISVPHLHVWK